MLKTFRTSSLILPLALAACAGTMRAPDAPQAVMPPTGSKYAMTAAGVGEITYECRSKAGAADTFEWVFVAPVATLYDRNKKVVGKYYAGPTWEASDGSKVAGKQLAVAPASGPQHIPLQLVQASAQTATGTGMMSDVAYIQRLNTMGGIAPTAPCNSSTAGGKQQVPYQADYVFYKK